jgi:hypothetical protein
VLFSFELSTDYNQILNNLTQSFGRKAATSSIDIVHQAIYMDGIKTQNECFISMISRISDFLADIESTRKGLGD